MERRPSNNDGPDGRGDERSGPRKRRFTNEEEEEEEEEPAGEVELVYVFGGDLYSTSAVFLILIAWMFKQATERCAC